jgi:hypothetical protein
LTNTYIFRLSGALFVSALIHAAAVLPPHLGQHKNVTNRTRVVASPAPGTITLTLLNSSPNQAPAPVEPASPAAMDSPPAEESTNSNVLAQQNPKLLISVLPRPDPVFYVTEMLTKRPKAVDAVDAISVATGSNGEPGKVVLKIWIDAYGDVYDVRPVGSKLPEAVLKPIITAFKASRFAPGERNGRAVGSVMLIEVNVDAAPAKPVDRTPM